jgi:uncharacterized protein (TIGR01777 family)
MTAGHIVIAGGSGFLGGLLTRFHIRQGRRVTLLSRNPQSHPGATTVRWDGRTRGTWEESLEGSDALINLCGASVNCRYHARNRKKLMDSRLLPTRLLGEVMLDLKHPPQVWLQAGTATLYLHTFGPGWDEEGETGADPRAKDAFSIELARAWEDAFRQALPAHTRGVLLRTAMVLGRGSDPNNVLHTLRRLVRWGLGGTMASGQQYVSWLHEDDFCRAVEWILRTPGLEGPVNLSAPHPLPNREMMQILRRQLHRPFCLPAPLPLLELGAWLIRTETELIIKSRRVLPGRLLDSGFTFAHPEFAAAVNDLIGSSP